MSNAEMREIIVEKINQLDDEKALQEVMEVLNSKSNDAPAIDATKNIDKLFKKHDGLLKRLS